MEHDYVLGTHDEEVQRLGVQHRVWRPRMLDAWAAAGITEGSRVVDLGCGPGYATVDLAELVGSQGTVLAIERSARFVAVARAACDQRGLTNVQVREADLMSDLALSPDCDAVWCRWVAMFVPNVPRLVRHVSSALRSGGCAVFHEYINHATLRTIPSLASVETFVAAAMASWTDAGGEPDVAASLVPTLRQAGFDIVETRPLIFVITPAEFFWQWPRTILRSYPPRLVERGYLTEAACRQVQEDFARFEQSPDARLVTPTVLQILARKR